MRNYISDNSVPNHLFLSRLQKPYLPLGSLRAQMLYPQSEDESLANNSVLEDILGEVQLGYLSDRYGGLDATRDWQDELSLGEQQVCCFLCRRVCTCLWYKPR